MFGQHQRTVAKAYYVLLYFVFYFCPFHLLYALLTLNYYVTVFYILVIILQRYIKKNRKYINFLNDVPQNIGQERRLIGCGNYPDCRYTRQLSQTGEAAEAAALDGKVLGIDPVTGLEVTLRNGRFGAYVQLGEAASKDDKPKRSSLPRGWDPASLDLERALMLLNLPRQIGLHPETQTPIVANFGRFGPYILHDGTYANMPSADDVFTIGLNHAVTLLAEKRAGGGKGFGRGATVLKDLGEHPDEGGKIEILDGKLRPLHHAQQSQCEYAEGAGAGIYYGQRSDHSLAERIAKGGGKSARKGKTAKPKASADGGTAKPTRAKAASKAKPAKAGKKAAKPRKDAAE